MEDKVYEIVASLLLRVSALEKILLEKGVITKEDYAEQLQWSVEELQKVAGNTFLS